MVTPLARQSADYPTNQLMLDMKCRKCGYKLGLLTESPEDRAGNLRVFGARSAAAWDNLEPSLP